MDKKHNIQAVILTDDGYKSLGELIKPYLHEGNICTYIHCLSAEQNGSFLEMQISPDACSGKVLDKMSISVPIGFVLFMASGINKLPIGFSGI